MSWEFHVSIYACCVAFGVAVGRWCEARRWYAAVRRYLEMHPDERPKSHPLNVVMSWVRW